MNYCKLAFTLLPGLFVALSSLTSHAQQAAEPAAGDKYLYLEDVSSPRAMAWVRDENARTAKVLEADPRFLSYAADALKIEEDPHRLASPEEHGMEIYNSWQDGDHVQGILRKTTRADYLSKDPEWQTVIDYDALSRQEKASWVGHGLTCQYPGDGLCMVSLSAGGEDAETMREFDLRKNQFVVNGFVLPRSKQNMAWRNADTVYVARDWGPGTMTKSGYPFVVKEWKRGTPLVSAKEVFRGTENDISASTNTLHDGQGHVLTIFERGLDFFSRQFDALTPEGPKRLGLPGKCYLTGMLDGRLLLTIQEDWKPEGQRSFKQGSLLALNLKDILADPAHLKPNVIFEPTATEFLGQAQTTHGHLVVTTLNHVQGRVYVYTPGDETWTRKPLPVGENLSVEISTTSAVDDQFFLTLSGFLTPNALYAGDAATGELKLAHARPALFDSSNDVVEQLEVTSKDGTKIPYFVVHSKSINYDGSNPTLLEAYGGFEVPMTPDYSATRGKLWLEHGGVYTLANIRGGGEFGPAWHEAGLKTHRQRIYDDFAAVGQDLITRKITSTPHLGILGGSNGGLLMGVEMTQHPDLWGAVVIEVPLLDMLRFEKIAAGASWVGEYGSVLVPEQRAFLAGISPYNQLKPGVRYPTPFLWTTTKDDRVGPQHARKFAAKMEEFHEPFYFDEIIEGGHGSGANLKQKARTDAETYVYLSRQLMPK